MASIAELYDYADSHGIIIDDTFRLDKVVAMSCPVDDDLCVVGLHRRLRGREYREHLAHDEEKRRDETKFGMGMYQWADQRHEHGHENVN